MPDEDIVSGDRNEEEPMFSAAEVRALIRQEMASVQQDHETLVSTFRAQIEAMQASMVGTVPVSIPKHGAGKGVGNHETWSQFEQERARAAEQAETDAKLAA